MFYVDFQRRENSRLSKKINEASRPPNKKDEFLLEDSEHQTPGLMKTNSEIPSILKGTGLVHYGRNETI